MAPVSVITEPDVIDRILTHLQLPLRPEQSDDGTVMVDVTEEPVLLDTALWQGDDYDSCGPPTNYGRCDHTHSSCRDRCILRGGSRRWGHGELEQIA